MDTRDGDEDDHSMSHDDDTYPMDLLATVASQASVTADLPQPIQVDGTSTGSGPNIVNDPAVATDAMPIQPPPGEGSVLIAVSERMGSHTPSTIPQHTTEPPRRKPGSSNKRSASKAAISRDSEPEPMDIDQLPPDQTLDRRPQPLATKPVYKKRTITKPTVPVSPSVSTPTSASATYTGLIRRGGVDSWRERRMEPRQEYQRPRPMNAYDLSTRMLEQKLLSGVRTKHSKKGAHSAASLKQPKSASEAVERHQATMLEKIEKLYTRPLPHRDVVRLLQMELDAEERTLEQMENRLRLEMTRLKVEEEILMKMLEMSADMSLDASMFIPEESSAGERSGRPSVNDTAATAAAPGALPLVFKVTSAPTPQTSQPQPLSQRQRNEQLQEQMQPTKRTPLYPPKPPTKARPSGTRVPRETPVLAQPAIPHVTGQYTSLQPFETSAGPSSLPTTSAATAATVTTAIVPPSVSVSTPSIRATPQPTAAPITSVHSGIEPPALDSLPSSTLPVVGGGTVDSSFMAALSILEQHEKADERRQQRGEDEESEDGETAEEYSDLDESEEGEEEEEEEDEEDEEAARSALRSMLAQLGGSF
ncbi:hypothetical protein BGW41_002683 [Actinomortierella wolfii]|nr:hypothetical protein BGW41_002683 [Actinomortierella wolfii]